MQPGAPAVRPRRPLPSPQPRVRGRVHDRVRVVTRERTIPERAGRRSPTPWGMPFARDPLYLPARPSVRRLMRALALAALVLALGAVAALVVTRLARP